jgi:hypothetical protein
MARNAAVLLLLTALVGGCAEGGWHKPGADPDRVREDFGACRALAHERMARATPAPAPPVKLDPRFGTTETTGTASEQRLQEQQLIDSCMREKGYRFVPAAR